MTDEQKRTLVQTMLGDYDSSEITTTVIDAYLDIAENTILKKLYPFGEPEEYTFKNDYEQCELALRYINRRGAEGETSHNENGINRSYGSVDDRDILDRIIPFAKI